VRLRTKLVGPFRYPVRWLAFLAGGVPAVLVFPGPSLSYLAWFALVPGMVLFARAATTREAVARGWWFGAGYLIAILHWMTPEVGPGVVLIGAVFGCMWSPFAIAVTRLLRPPVSWPRVLAALAVVPATWLVPEWIRSYQGLGGPWGLYGASQWQHPAVLALASVGGVWLVSVALVIANAGLTVLIGAIRPALLAPASPALAAAGLPVPAQPGDPTADDPGARLLSAPVALDPTVADITAPGTTAPGTTAPDATDRDAAARRARPSPDGAAAPASAAAPGAGPYPAAAPVSGAPVSAAALDGADPEIVQAVLAAPQLPPASQTRRLALAAAGVAAFAVAAGSGPLAYALTAPFASVRQTSIALVQPGIIDNPAARVDASESLTRKFFAGATGQAKPDLIVWGESSVAYDLATNSTLLNSLKTLSAQAKSEIMVSQDSTLPGTDGGQEKVAVLLSPQGIEGRYVKTRLVPFGEYIPFRQQLGWLTKLSKAASSNMIPGNGAHTLTVNSPNGPSQPLDVGVLVCFESAFPDMSRVEVSQGAQVIVYQSSTSTFQGTWGPEQQGSLGALRAAETGRPVVQAALTGDSVAFDARGRELAWLGQDDRGVVTVTLNLPSASTRTFYDQAGDYVMWSGVGITALAALVMLLRRRHFLGNTTGATEGRTAEYDADTGDPVRS
jgi:apolipoprotein N-acyltransferase